jgi:hypothetical protein
MVSFRRAAATRPHAAAAPNHRNPGALGCVDGRDVSDRIKYYPYYAIPFEIVLPALLWIVSEIRARKRRGQEGEAGIRQE